MQMVAMSKYEIALVGRDIITIEADKIIWGDSGCIVLLKEQENKDDIVGLFPIHSLVGIIKIELKND